MLLYFHSLGLYIWICTLHWHPSISRADGVAPRGVASAGMDVEPRSDMAISEKGLVL